MQKSVKKKKHNHPYPYYILWTSWKLPFPLFKKNQIYEVTICVWQNTPILKCTFWKALANLHPHIYYPSRRRTFLSLQKVPCNLSQKALPHLQSQATTGLFSVPVIWLIFYRVWYKCYHTVLLLVPDFIISFLRFIRVVGKAVIYPFLLAKFYYITVCSSRHLDIWVVSTFRPSK